MTYRSPLDKWLVVLDSNSGTPVLIRACTTPWALGHTPAPCYHTNLHSHHKAGDVINVPQTHMRAPLGCRVGGVIAEKQSRTMEQKGTSSVASSELHGGCRV